MQRILIFNYNNINIIINMIKSKYNWLYIYMRNFFSFLDFHYNKIILNKHVYINYNVINSKI